MVSACLSSSVKSMKTSAAPYPGIHNPIVVYLMSCTQQVRGARDSCHGKNRFPRSIVQLMLLQHGHCTFVTILFKPFARLCINLAMCIRALFTKSATTLGLVEQAFWRMPFFTESFGASLFEVILAGQSKFSPTGTLSSGTSGSR